MPTITRAEQFDGATFKHGPNPSWSIPYEFKGDEDRLAIRDDAIANLPANYDDMPLQELEIEAFGASDEWLVTALYAPDGYTPGSITIPETGTSSFSFDTGGGNQHITKSLETIFADASGIATVPVFDGAIGVTANGIEGVDITVPVFQFKETHYIAASLVTTGYKKALATLTGRTNAGVFQDFAIGEVLFLGASGTYRASQDDWEITYNFAQSDNRDDLVVGDIIDIPKKGWEYLWVRYKDEVGAGGEAMVKTVDTIHVERVYEAGDFAGLNPV